MNLLKLSVFMIFGILNSTEITHEISKIDENSDLIKINFD